MYFNGYSRQTGIWEVSSGIHYFYIKSFRLLLLLYSLSLLLLPSQFVISALTHSLLPSSPFSMGEGAALKGCPGGSLARECRHEDCVECC